jgi:hypothetical protein
MGVLGAAAGALTPKYKLPSKSLGTALGAVGGIAKGFGNSIVNQAGDALSGGIMKLAGLNTDKMISGYDQGANAIADVVSRFGPYGMIASLAIKGVNSLFASGIQDINKDERVMASTGFAGSVGDIERAADRYGGGTVGGIGTLFGDKDKAEARIAEA